MRARVASIAILLVNIPHAAACAGISIRAVEHVVYGASAADLFRRPMGLAIDAERGVLVVADTGNNRIVLFDASGRARGSMSWGSDDPGMPTGELRVVSIDAQARLFVLDALGNEIEVLNAAGSRLGLIEPDAPLIHDGSRPQSLAVGASGRLYVLYAGATPGIVILNPDGSTVQRLGFDASGAGLLTSPTALAVDAGEQRIAVADPLAAHQVRIFDVAGNSLTSFGPHGEGNGTFSVATFVCWGPASTLWVIDAVRHSISVFDSDGRQLGLIGGFGRLPGQFYYPAACGFLARDRIVVLERGTSRFQVLALDLSLGDEPSTVRSTGSRTGEPSILISEGR